MTDSNDSALSGDGETTTTPATANTAEAAPPPPSSSAAGQNAVATAADPSFPEPQPGCSHWTQENAATAAAAVPSASSVAATAVSATNNSNSGSSSPLQRVSSSSAVPIDWEGMYNDLYARHASLITRLQVTPFLFIFFKMSLNIFLIYINFSEVRYAVARMATGM